MQQWTPFEEYVIKELSSIGQRISRLEGRAGAWGAVTGAIVACLVEVAATLIRHN